MINRKARHRTGGEEIDDAAKMAHIVEAAVNRAAFADITFPVIL